MKTKTILITLIAMLFTTAVVFQGCKKEEENINQLPTCTILVPTNGQEIEKGETVTISVDANDSDGNITEVRFFINGIGKNSSTSFPYDYNWNTSNESFGTHTLKSTSIDNDGGSTSDEITVTIIENSGNVPVANFSANITSGTVPLTVNFTDQSTNNPTTWQWEFGDGGTSTEQNPTHTYNTDGSYTVTFNVSNNYGSHVESKADYIVVSNSSADTYTDPRDGQTYTIIEIGSQMWMSENLNYETTDSWWYDNDPSNGNIYGRLYNWEAATTACPDGWHLPTDSEWKTLEMALGMSQSDADGIDWRGTTEGNKLKSEYGWNSNGNGTNSSGFTAIPGGRRSIDGLFDNILNYGNWWSSSDYLGTFAWIRGLSYDNNQVHRGNRDKTRGFSVRCLRN